jgi:hypothetical protein
MRRKAPCYEPGCPNLIEPTPFRQFCEDHDDQNADLSSVWEDDARGALDQMLYEAKGSAGVFQKSEKWSFEQYATSQIILHVPYVLDAAEDGDVWTAVRHALWVGRMAGLSEGAPDREKLRRQEPQVRVGRDVLEGAKRAGEAKRGKYRADPDVLRADVLELHERHPDDSWTTVCDFVGRRHGYKGGRQVRNLIPDTKW